MTCSSITSTLSLLSIFLTTTTTLDILVFPDSRKENIVSNTCKFNSVSNITFHNISFCFWVKVNHLKSAKVLHYNLPDARGFGFTLQEEYGFINLKTVDLLFDYLTPHIPDKWSHFCGVYDVSKERITVYMNGQMVLDRSNITVLSGTQFNSQILQHMGIGNVTTLT